MWISISFSVRLFWNVTEIPWDALCEVSQVPFLELSAVLPLVEIAFCVGAVVMEDHQFENAPLAWEIAPPESNEKEILKSVLKIRKISEKIH